MSYNLIKFTLIFILILLLVHSLIKLHEELSKYHNEYFGFRHWKTTYTYYLNVRKLDRLAAKAQRDMERCSTRDRRQKRLEYLGKFIGRKF